MNSGYWKSLWVGLTAIAFSVLIFNEEVNPSERHQFYLDNSPFKETKHLGKIERLNRGLTPDRFYEEMFELTMNPSTGIPDYSSKQRVQQLVEQTFKYKIAAVPGQDMATPWYTIGPNNHAGRTRAALFDIADTPNYDRVIAGGVSGGLWQNTDIDNSSQQWTRITGVPGNLAVSLSFKIQPTPISCLPVLGNPRQMEPGMYLSLYRQWCQLEFSFCSLRFIDIYVKWF